MQNISARSGAVYQVESSGLSAGDVQYIDRAFLISQVPTAVTGAVFIRTANDDKNAFPGATDFLTFDVDVDAVVYVAHDDRIQAPQWLASGFTDTGDDVTSAGGTFSLFRGEFGAGTVQLGSNADQAAGSSMYTVIVMPQPGVDTTAPAAPTGLHILSN